SGVGVGAAGPARAGDSPAGGTPACRARPEEFVSAQGEGTQGEPVTRSVVAIDASGVRVGDRPCEGAGRRYLRSELARGSEPAREARAAEGADGSPGVPCTR